MKSVKVSTFTSPHGQTTDLVSHRSQQHDETTCIFDQANGILWYQGQPVSLTPRETALLALLFTAPRRFHQTYDLASKLSRRCKVPITEHSIQQTISTLRRKLDKQGEKQGILQSRYGFGYGFFSPVPLILEDHPAPMPLEKRCGPIRVS